MRRRKRRTYRRSRLPRRLPDEGVIEEIVKLDPLSGVAPQESLEEHRQLRRRPRRNPTHPTNPETHYIHRSLLFFFNPAR